MGATAEGQRELLAEYGISQAALGVPVKTDMTTVQLGTNSWGEPVFWDKNAFEADAVVTISRVKAHTDFRGRYESGIVKMLGIGLGKRDGANQHHRWGLRGLSEMLVESVSDCERRVCRGCNYKNATADRRHQSNRSRESHSTKAGPA